MELVYKIRILCPIGANKHKIQSEISDLLEQGWSVALQINDGGIPIIYMSYPINGGK